MTRGPPRSTRTDTPFPYTTRVRSCYALRTQRLFDPARHVVAGHLDGGKVDADANGHDLAILPVPFGERLRRFIHRPSAERIDKAGFFGHRNERSEEHTSELQSLMRISYAVFGLKKKKTRNKKNYYRPEKQYNNNIT